MPVNKPQRTENTACTGLSGNGFKNPLFTGDEKTVFHVELG